MHLFNSTTREAKTIFRFRIYLSCDAHSLQSGIVKLCANNFYRYIYMYVHSGIARPASHRRIERQNHIQFDDGVYLERVLH